MMSLLFCEFLLSFVFASYRVYCLIGDGESAEGSVWEALHFSSHYQLDNLVAVFDINRLGQSEATSLQHRMDVYDQRLKAFGCEAPLARLAAIRLRSQGLGYGVFCHRI